MLDLTILAWLAVCRGTWRCRLFDEDVEASWEACRCRDQCSPLAATNRTDASGQGEYAQGVRVH